ncbi:unnamed protein product, partial [Urochloa humidicola]
LGRLVGFVGREMGGRNSAAATPVLLNVYDLTAANDYLYWFGFGVFHSGIEGFVYRRTVWLGTTDMSPEEFRSFIEKLAGKYHGNTYHLINKNCNHFTDDVCQSLTGKPIPSWVNRLARVGSVFDCLLPESVQVSPVGRVPTLRQSSDDDLYSIHSPIIEDSDNDEDETKHLLPTPSNDMHSVDVPPKLAKDLL